MQESTHYVGLDVHKDSITIAVAEAGREPARVLATIDHDLPTLRRRLRRLGEAADVAVCYEAGPTGYGLYRRLLSWGYDVTASKTPRPAGGRRVKTDHRDALDLAHFLRAAARQALPPADRLVRLAPEMDRRARRRPCAACVSSRRRRSPASSATCVVSRAPATSWDSWGSCPPSTAAASHERAGGSPSRATRTCGAWPQKLVVAVARELAGFVWAIGQQPKLLA